MIEITSTGSSQPEESLENSSLVKGTRTALLSPGAVIGGYEIVRPLGAGSMGQVYLSCHTELTHYVAMKVLFPEVAQDEVASARFRNEIFAAYGVCHPNVVRAYEYLKEGDLLAYTMEYVAGTDLGYRMEQHPPFSTEEMVNLLTQVCDGLQAIHNAGIVHRDLKPENILLTPQKMVKIADFGIARADAQPRLTEHGGIIGTINYVSPEYLLKSQLDSRSDLYAVGVLAYEMVVGDPPFRGKSIYETMMKRVKGDPVSPAARNPRCPEDLDAIIMKALARDPDARFSSAAEMKEALERFLKDFKNRSSAYALPPCLQGQEKLLPAGVGELGAAQLISSLVYRDTVYQPFIPASLEELVAIASPMELPAPPPVIELPLEAVIETKEEPKALPAVEEEPEVQEGALQEEEPVALQEVSPARLEQNSSTHHEVHLALTLAQVRALSSTTQKKEDEEEEIEELLRPQVHAPSPIVDTVLLAGAVVVGVGIGVTLVTRALQFFG